MKLFQINLGAIVEVSGKSLLEFTDISTELSEKINPLRTYTFMNMGKVYIGETMYIWYPYEDDSRVFEDEPFLYVYDMDDVKIVRDVGPIRDIKTNIQRRLLYAMTSYIEEPMNEPYLSNEIDIAEKSMEVVSILSKA
jgi:hypothetical protein